VTRDKFSSHVPDLVRTDHDTRGLYAPVVLTTNRDVSSIPPDLTKRMVTCHIDAAIPENRSVGERIARRAGKEIGTALYRAYLGRLIPEVRAMRAAIDAEADGFPDLLARSSAILRGVFAEALGDAPAWARPLTFTDYFGIRHQRFRDQLADMLAASDERVTVTRRAHHQLRRGYEPGRPVRPQRAGLRPQGALCRSRQTRSARTGAGNGLCRRANPGVVAAAVAPVGCHHAAGGTGTIGHTLYVRLVPRLGAAAGAQGAAAVIGALDESMQTCGVWPGSGRIPAHGEGGGRCRSWCGG
jgi:hypothetical protein